MKTFFAAVLLVLTACGGAPDDYTPPPSDPPPSDPCPGQKLCGNNFCIPESAECCSQDGHYCSSGNFCDTGNRCTTNGYVSCVDSAGNPDGYECPAATGCSTVVGYCR